MHNIHNSKYSANGVKQLIQIYTPPAKLQFIAGKICCKPDGNSVQSSKQRFTIWQPLYCKLMRGYMA